MPVTATPAKKSAVAREAKTSREEPDETIIWGEHLEKNDFIKVPRTFALLGQYASGADPKIRLAPRHIVLLLALAGRRFKGRPLRAYWEELASYLGSRKETVRKWAYELKGMGLLAITQRRGRDPEKNRVGYRNEANVFDLSPFVEFLQKAKAVRDRDRKSNVLNQRDKGK